MTRAEPQYVYLVKCGPLTKVGVSGNPPQRIRGISNPFAGRKRVPRKVVVGIWNCTAYARQVEGLVKGQFKKERHYGYEWFKLKSDAVLPFVAETVRHHLGTCAVAEFERDLTAERTRRGMKSKADRGHHVGRPPKFTAERVAQIRKLLKQGYAISAVAKRMKLSEPGIRSRFKIERIKPKKKGDPVKYVVTEKKD